MGATSDRRKFLKFLAASPLLAVGGGSLVSGDAEDPVGNWFQGQQEPFLIKTPEEALNVFDFEAKAHAVMPAGHWAELATGVDDDGTLRANREGFSKLVWNPRRLVDVEKTDLSIEVFGQKLGSPIFTCPTTSNKRFHPEGELAVARASKKNNNMQMISTSSGYSMQDVIEARGALSWFQLYFTNGVSGTRKIIEHVEAAGAPAIAFTVDQLAGNNRESADRGLRVIPGYTGQPHTSPACNGCHTVDMRSQPRDQMFKRPEAIVGNSVPKENFPNTRITWDTVRQLRDTVKGKFMIKGIMTPEDAELSIKYGLDAVYVSNHGGRSTATDLGTIEALPDIAKAVGGRVPIFIDGGVRRGTDIFKALALGATAVGIGRPYDWGLATFGQAGVTRVLDILQRELRLVMQQAGTPSVAAIAKAHYVTPRPAGYYILPR